jgi:hypothetical protein
MQDHTVNPSTFIKINDIDSDQIGDDAHPRRNGAHAEPRERAGERPANGTLLADRGTTDFSSILASPKFFYRWGRLLSSTLSRLRSKFDGDFDQYLIYMVFVLTDLSRRAQISSPPSRGQPFTPKEIGLNTLSVADITEIPRETARRKLRLLVASGYLCRRPNQLYYLGDRYDPDEFLLDLAPLFNDFSVA